jgi:hypothetical protein
MNDDEKMEFWKSLGRLYDETLELRAVAEAHQNAAANLRVSCEALQNNALAREKPPR